MAKVIISDGSVDGFPAKVMYYPDSKQTQIYWGGRGKPDGDRHNHATIQDSNPDAFHFIEDVENHVLRAWSEFNGFAS